MNGEAGPSGSIGAVGAGVATAGAVGPSMGTGMGGEISTGVGFDKGSPTFSGLGRMDTFGTPSMGIPEGPVRDDIFSNTEVIARNPNLGSKPIISTEPVSIFDNTSPFQAVIPANEGPVSSFSLKDTFVIAKTNNQKDEVEASLGTLEPEVSVEEAVQSYFEISEPESTEVTIETINDAVDDLKTDDPQAYTELTSGLKSVEKILNLVGQVGTDTQTEADISNQAIETVVQRIGLIKAIEEETAHEAEPETDVEPDSADYVRNETELETDAELDAEDSEKPVVPTNTKSAEDKFVRDEAAMSARAESLDKAITTVQESQPEGDSISGDQIVTVMEEVTTDQEISELARKAELTDDGSRIVGKNEIKNAKFNKADAKSSAQAIIDRYPGVKEARSGVTVADEDVARIVDVDKYRKEKLIYKAA